MLKSIRKVGWPELLAVLFIVPGSVLIPIVGWAMGMVLLWSSDRWSRSDKLVATLVWPGGLGAVGVLGLEFPASESEICGGPPDAQVNCPPAGESGIPEPLTAAVFALLVIFPMFVAWRLLRNAYKMSDEPQPDVGR